jgi:hypothetical protein
LRFGPRHANADQADLDEEGLGDVIDETVLPGTAAACRDRGWTRFYRGSARFRNQGDCVSFVSTGERSILKG